MQLKAERQLNTIAQREKILEMEQPPQFQSNANDAEGINQKKNEIFGAFFWIFFSSKGKWLDELTEGMDIREGEHIAFGDVELLEEVRWNCFEFRWNRF